MYLENISVTWQDYPSKEDCAILIYLQGCSHACEDCQNIKLQTINKDNWISPSDLYVQVKELCLRNKTTKLVFQGGDPLFNANIDSLSCFLYDYGHLFDICIYTGYSIDYVKKQNKNNFCYIAGFKYIKCGVYDNKLLEKKYKIGKTEKHLVFASKNQKLYNSNYRCISNKNIFKLKE